LSDCSKDAWSRSLKRFLVECTYVFEHPDDNSGIQRVVRNVVRELEHVNSDYEFIPVIMRGSELRRVLNLSPVNVSRNTTRTKRLISELEHWRNRLWYFHSRVERLALFRASHNFRRTLLVVTKLLSLSITLPLRSAMFLTQDDGDALRSQVMLARPGDLLVLLDSSWHAEFFDLATRLKAEGVGIVSVVYDLIPLTHPQFCHANLVKVFEVWFKWISTTADCFMAISETISLQLQAVIASRAGSNVSSVRHAHFRLGSDLDLALKESAVDERLKRVFGSGQSIYLMVSTIEPRKNHAYLLDAFELLWAQGHEQCLCIIGKIGWKCEELVGRIRNHAEFNKRMFMFNGANDSSLNFAYAHTKALVFPSFVEGFGLPLVEAMQHGLPAFASDIPVFREVGGEFLSYFDLADPNSLAKKIQEFEGSGVFPASRPVSEWTWPNWREATQEFVDQLVALQDRSSPKELSVDYSRLPSG
jgi:O-antigen biosynthesis alpha-1,2-rhamnosyltransferase